MLQHLSATMKNKFNIFKGLYSHGESVFPVEAEIWTVPLDIFRQTGVCTQDYLPQLFYFLLKG